MNNGMFQDALENHFLPNAQRLLRKGRLLLLTVR
jgi:hypothetical protein